MRCGFHTGAQGEIISLFAVHFVAWGGSLGRGMGLDYVRGTEAGVWAEEKGDDIATIEFFWDLSCYSYIHRYLGMARR